jgi:DNA-binding transcriptional regulator YdaS (Cro superfamily)
MNALREWRKKLAPEFQSLEAAAKLLGVSKAQLSRYENGRRQVAPERVGHFEAITNIPREVLRPDVFGPVKKKVTA